MFPVAISANRDLHKIAEDILGPDRFMDELVQGEALSGKALKEHQKWMLFRTLFDARAFFNAAMLLVPEHHMWTIDSKNYGWSAGIWRGSRWLVYPWDTQADTPELALANACQVAHHKLVAAVMINQKGAQDLPAPPP